MLQSAGFIVASATSYPLKDVIAAIENSVGASPTVVCSKGAVKEIRICFYKNFEVNIYLEGLKPLFNSNQYIYVWLQMLIISFYFEIATGLCDWKQWQL